MHLKINCKGEVRGNMTTAESKAYRIKGKENESLQDSLVPCKGSHLLIMCLTR